MRENYGLCSLWDVNNNCFIALSPDYEFCRGMGKTHAEAVAALDDEVQEWIKTGRELGVDVSYVLPSDQEQLPLVSEAPFKFPMAVTKEPEQKARNSPLKAIGEAIKAAQEDALSVHPLDYTVTLNPCIIRIQGEMSFLMVLGVRDEILGLALQHNRIIFDLSEVGYIDSVGLSLLVESRRRMSFPDASLSVVVSGVKDDQVEGHLRLTRLDTIMHVLPSLEEAIAISQEKKLSAP